MNHRVVVSISLVTDNVLGIHQFICQISSEKGEIGVLTTKKRDINPVDVAVCDLDSDIIPQPWHVKLVGEQNSRERMRRGDGTACPIYGKKLIMKAMTR